ncbi:MAG TPA: hypothetical protein VEA99_01230, partial [Gemmatimonadaceae bacterium]|nr:hypothetical protein [Gemmatimonadaceae bacterium]
WLLDHGARARAQALEAAPERFRPRVANGVIVRTEHECVGREWSSSRCEIVLDVPFIRQMQCPWWFEALLLRCDGETDARALRAGLIRDGLVPPDADETGLPPMLLRLVEQGVLEVPEWPLPPRATSEEG